MRIALLGAGGWGKNLVRVFCDVLGPAAVLVCEPDATRREAISEAHPGIEVSADNRFEDGIDAVVIAAPAALHAALTEQALRAGKHVLVEKPITLRSAQAEDLIRLAGERQRILMVDHLLEYHPAVDALKALVDEGRLGRLLHLTSQRLNLGVIRTEENALWSLAPHDISIMLYLMNEEPEVVGAHGYAYLQPEVEDVANLTLRFPSGALGHVHVSWLDPVKTRRLTVVGDRGMAVFDDMAEAKLALFDRHAKVCEGGFCIHRGDMTPVPIAGAEPLRALAEVFLESIRTGAAPRSDGADGLRVVRVLEAAHEILQRGGGP